MKIRFILPHIKIVYFWIAFYGLMLGLTLNNTLPHRGDESFYIASSIHMQQSGNYLTPVYFDKFRFQKPILTYWITLAGYKLLGIHLWTGRLPFLVMTCAMLLLIYKFALLILKDQDFALLNVFLLSSSTLFIEFSRVSMTDLPLTFFTTLGLYYFCKALTNPGNLKRYYFFAFIFVGLAVSAKSFAGIFPVLAILVYVLCKKPQPFKHYTLYLFNPMYWIVMVVLGFSWYGYIYLQYPTELINQLGGESSKHLALTFSTFLGHSLYYSQKITTYYLPFTVMAIYIYLRKRYPIPNQLLLVIVYLTIMLMVLLFVVGEHKSRYLLVIFPEITLLTSYLIYRHNLGVLAKKIAIGWALLQILIFLCYPLISGAPLRNLVQFWEKNETGELSSYGLSRRETTWLQALSNGKLQPYNGCNKYIIVKSDKFEGFDTYKVVHQAEKLQSIGFKDRHFSKKYQTYLLVKSSP